MSNPSDVCKRCGVARGWAPIESTCIELPGVHAWAAPATEADHRDRALDLLATAVDHLKTIRDDVHEIRLLMAEIRGPR